MTEEFDTNIESVIAEILKDFGRINEKNVEAILREFELRDITVDRDGKCRALVFRNRRTGIHYKLDRSMVGCSAQRIRSIEEFFNEVNAFLKRVEIRKYDVDYHTESDDRRWDGGLLTILLEEQVLAPIPAYDNPDYFIGLGVRST